MNTKKYIVLSACANVGLAFVAFHLFRMPATHALAFAAKPGETAFRIQRDIAADSPARVIQVANRFQWHTIESEDYEEYVANLRAIGCPEKTIRDIILADVENLYANRRRELRFKDPFWLAGSRRRKAERAREQDLETLRCEEGTLIRRLLGIEWCPDGDLRFDKVEEQALVRFVFGPMAEESVQRVVHLMGKYEALRREVERRCDGIRLEEDNAQLDGLYRLMWQEIASALTPLQLEEMQARGAAFELLDHTRFDGVDVTAMELRRIALAWAAGGGRLFDWPDEESDADRKAGGVQFKTTIRQILGDRRGADFERAQDAAFRNLFEIARDNGLPKATAVAVYDLRNLAMEEAGLVRQDASLDEPARRQRLEEMQTAIQKEISDALGAEAWNHYLNRGGSWVTNLGKL